MSNGDALAVESAGPMTLVVNVAFEYRDLLLSDATPFRLFLSRLQSVAVVSGSGRIWIHVRAFVEAT